MQREILACLYDILDCGNYILEITNGISSTEFQSNRMIRQTAERNFEIIGEAINRILKKDKELVRNIPDYRRIIDFRNIISHGYFELDSEIVFSIINDRLPEILNVVRNLYSYEKQNQQSDSEIPEVDDTDER